MSLPKIIDGHVFHQYTIQVEARHRDPLQAFLSEEMIETLTYYPIPTSRQKAMLDKSRVVSDVKSCDLALKSLSLPISPTITEQEIDYICKSIFAYYERVGT